MYEEKEEAMTDQFKWADVKVESAHIMSFRHGADEGMTTFIT